MTDAYLSSEQVAQLLRPIHPSRVSTRDGMSHLEAYDVRAHLNRIFGFARWSADLVALDCLYETVSEDGKRVSVGYRATMRLTVDAPDGTRLASYTEAAAGSATNFPITKRSDAADFAIKTAESQALKRCVTNLGDQFGLSLYQKGSRDALVKRTLVMPDGDEPKAAAETDVAHDAAPVTPEITPRAGEEAQSATTNDGSGQATSPKTPASDPQAGRTLPAAAPIPPEPAPQQEANNPEHIAEKLRDRALALYAGRGDRKRNEVIQDLGRVGLEASGSRVQQVMVRRENGEQVTLSVLLDELIKNCTRSAA